MALPQNHPPLQPASSDSAFPIFAIIVLSILATAFLLITYFTFVTRCCSNWPFTCLSILRPPPNEDPSIAFSPSMWNRGLHDSVIREIPTFQFVKPAAQDEDNPGVYCCVVCLTEFQEHEMLRVLPNCAHAFHLDCIDVWLQNNANCPLCRSSISGSTPAPIDHIIAPNSSPQLLSNMGSVEDFVVIEVGGEHGEVLSQSQPERNESRECVTHSRSHSTRKTEQKASKCHHVSIMGDECIDVGNKDDQICIQPIRRSFSMDSANDRQVYSDVQAIMHPYEGGASEECNSRGRRSLFPFHYGRGSKNAVLPLENEV